MMQEQLEKFEIARGGAEGKLVYNFSPGPCILPDAVLKKCQEEMIDYRGTGRSVMELNHRSAEFENIDRLTKLEIKNFLNVPDTHVVMLNQGGATMQYAAICKNLIGLRPARKGMFFVTGLWSSQCFDEAKKFIPEDKLICVTDLTSNNFTKMSDPSTWKIDPEASFVHICMNETVHGLEISERDFPWHLIPKDVVVVGDMSSNMGTCHVDWDRFGVVYAGAQKNMGPSGCTIIIVKKSLLGHADPDVPVLCDWTTNANSLPSKGFAPGYYNTPPVWPVYVTGLNVSYMNQKGGIDVYKREAAVKSQMLWDLCDNSGGYYNIKMEKAYRSRINCIFRIGCPVKGTPALEKKFLRAAGNYKLTNLNGHVENPGIRVSMYNAMPIQGVVELCHFMAQFQKENPLPAAEAKM